MNEVGHNSSSKVKIECPEEEDTERRVSAIILLVSVAFSLPLKNCVLHIICHFLEGKFFCIPRRGHFTLSDTVL